MGGYSAAAKGWMLPSMCDFVVTTHTHKSTLALVNLRHICTIITVQHYFRAFEMATGVRYKAGQDKVNMVSFFGKFKVRVSRDSNEAVMFVQSVFLGIIKWRVTWDYYDYEVDKLVVGFFAMYLRSCDTGEKTSAHTTSMSHMWLLRIDGNTWVFNKWRVSRDYNNYEAARLGVGFFAVYRRLCDTGGRTAAQSTMWIVSGNHNDYEVAKLVVGFFAMYQGLCDTGGKTPAHTTSMSQLWVLWTAGIIGGSSKWGVSWVYCDYEVAKLVVGFFAMYRDLCDTGGKTSAHTTSGSPMWCGRIDREMGLHETFLLI